MSDSWNKLRFLLPPQRIQTQEEHFWFPPTPDLTPMKQGILLPYCPLPPPPNPAASQIITSHLSKNKSPRALFWQWLKKRNVTWSKVPLETQRTCVHRARETGDSDSEHNQVSHHDETLTTNPPEATVPLTTPMSCHLQGIECIGQGAPSAWAVYTTVLSANLQLWLKGRAVIHLLRSGLWVDTEI